MLGTCVESPQHNMKNGYKLQMDLSEEAEQRLYYCHSGLRLLLQICVTLEPNSGRKRCQFPPLRCC